MDVSAEEASTVTFQPAGNRTTRPAVGAADDRGAAGDARAGGRRGRPRRSPLFEEVFEEESPRRIRPGRGSVDAHAGAASDDFGFVRTPDVIGSPAAPSVPSAAAPETVREGFGWARPADLPARRPRRARARRRLRAGRRARAGEARTGAREASPPPAESSFSSVADVRPPASPRGLRRRRRRRWPCRWTWSRRSPSASWPRSRRRSCARWRGRSSPSSPRPDQEGDRPPQGRAAADLSSRRPAEARSGRARRARSSRTS